MRGAVRERKEARREKGSVKRGGKKEIIKTLLSARVICSACRRR